MCGRVAAQARDPVVEHGARQEPVGDLPRDRAPAAVARVEALLVRGVERREVVGDQLQER